MLLRPKRDGAGRVAEAEESRAGQVAEADRERRERSRVSCWLKEVEAERGAAEAVVEKRPVERVDVAEDSWKEVEGEQDRTRGGDVGSRQAPQTSRSIVGAVSVQSGVTNVSTTWWNTDHQCGNMGPPKDVEKYDLLVEKNRVATRRKAGRRWRERKSQVDYSGACANLKWKNVRA